VRTVVEFDGEDDSGRPRFAEHEVEVLLGNGRERPAEVASHGTGDHVGKANLAHDKELATQRMHQRPVKCRLSAGKQGTSTLVGQFGRPRRLYTS